MTLTLEQKKTIISKYNEGKTIREITQDMKINKNTVNKWTKQYNEQGTLKRKRGTGLYKRIIQIKSDDNIKNNTK